ncbi:MAG TPA: glycosyltransferase [Nitrospirota bacterium]|nr:glycosyltransferase [Nitrospirota bacterium]
MQKLLFICNDFIGNAMAGPGIRAWELAHALERKGHQTAILSRYFEKEFSRGSITFAGRASFTNLFSWIRRSDCIILPGRPLAIIITILFQKKLIFDQYDPVIFEFLERKPLNLYDVLHKRVMLLLWKIRQRLILRFGNGFLVANEKQKDFLIGQLALLGYSDKLGSVVVLPFGMTGNKPRKTQMLLRGSRIRNTDFLLVWGGGIWDWFDPLTLLEALSRIKALRDDIKVYFPGIKPPSPDSEKMAVTDAFMARALALGLLDSTVFVNAGWTSYVERANYLLEADAGISLHRDSLETRFAFRTRILDYLWAGLPVIASKGDCWADIIEKQGLGITVSPGDVDSVMNAILKLADNKQLKEQYRDNVRSAAAGYRWDQLVEKIEFPPDCNKRKPRNVTP